jgi:hypothetical protein
MSSKRRRSARPGSAKFQPGSNLEALETRQLLTHSPYLTTSQYPVTNSLPLVNPGSVPIGPVVHPIGTNPAILAGFQNEGRDLFGQDRQGNRWELKLTGPGEIIVTDVTPTDGVLDDNINTITLVGTDPNKSVLTGAVQASYYQPTSETALTTLGQVYFNALVANKGVKSIVLNGFVLTDTITPPGSATTSPLETSLNQTTGINLAGGVGYLAFEGIDGRFPTPTAADATLPVINPSMTSVPIDIVIGNATTPQKVQPNIRIDHIYNTQYDSNVYSVDSTFGTVNPTTIATGPLTSPTIDLVVNGGIKSFDVVSISQEPNLATLLPDPTNLVLNIPTEYIPTASASLAYYFPVVGTTGRTAVQASSINHIKSSGSVTNVTFSKAIQPFVNSLSGMDSVGYVQFGGQTDAVAIDSRGSIHLLKFVKGLGNPTGLSTNPIYYGTPTSAYGYAALGQIGVQVVSEGIIGSLVAGPNGQFLQVSQNPASITGGLNETTVYVSQPGVAATQSLVAAGGSIGKLHIIGNLVNTEIKSGYNYYAALGGSEGVSSPSTIGPVTVRGNLVDSVISATYRPNDTVYGNGNDTAGAGAITGTRSGGIYTTQGTKTVLGNQGSGLFARKVKVKVHPAGSTQVNS